MVLNATMDEYLKIVEVVGSIPTRNSEIFSVVPSTVAKQPAFITLISLAVKWKKLFFQLYLECCTVCLVSDNAISNKFVMHMH